MSRLWRWFLSLFKLVPKALPSGTPVSAVKPSDGAILIAIEDDERAFRFGPAPQEESSIVPLTQFDGLFLEAAEAELRKHREEEQKIFGDDEELRKRLANIIATMIDRSIQENSAEIIITSVCAGLSDRLFDALFPILRAVCAPYKIEMQNRSSGGAWIKRQTVLDVIERMKLQRHIDIDERIRAMTHMGVYR